MKHKYVTHPYVDPTNGRRIRSLGFCTIKKVDEAFIVKLSEFWLFLVKIDDLNFAILVNMSICPLRRSSTWVNTRFRSRNSTSSISTATFTPFDHQHHSSWWPDDPTYSPLTAQRMVQQAYLHYFVLLLWSFCKFNHLYRAVTLEAAHL